MNVRPTYRFLIRPSSYGIPEALAKPIAAGVPESGIGITRSATAGASSASRSPMRTRLVWTSLPASRESGRAK